MWQGDLGLKFRFMTSIMKAPSKVKEVIPEEDTAGARNHPLRSNRWVLGALARAISVEGSGKIGRRGSGGSQQRQAFLEAGGRGKVRNELGQLEGEAGSVRSSNCYPPVLF